MTNHDHRTLDELDPPAWGQPSFDSYLVRTCHELRKKRLVEMDAEDLRILIGQRIGLGFLLPYALNALERDPLAAGDFYPGDLLVSVLRAICAERQYLSQYADRVEGVLGSLESDKVVIQRAVAEFRRNVV